MPSISEIVKDENFIPLCFISFAVAALVTLIFWPDRSASHEGEPETSPTEPKIEEDKLDTTANPVVNVAPSTAVPFEEQECPEGGTHEQEILEHVYEGRPTFSYVCTKCKTLSPEAVPFYEQPCPEDDTHDPIVVRVRKGVVHQEYSIRKICLKCGILSDEDVPYGKLPADEPFVGKKIQDPDTKAQFEVIDGFYAIDRENHAEVVYLIREAFGTDVVEVPARNLKSYTVVEEKRVETKQDSSHVVAWILAWILVLGLWGYNLHLFFY